MIGFVVGPGIGGFLSDYWTRAPFAVAALVAGINLLLIVSLMKESHDPEKHPARDISYNPLSPIIWVMGFKPLRVMLGAYVLVSMVGQLGVTMWPIWGNVEFGWSQAQIGLSLTAFSILAALVQFFVVGALSDKVGEIPTVGIGMIFEGIGYVGIALAFSPLVALIFMPFLAMGGISQPALQGAMSRRVDEEHQGRMMGALAGITGVAMALSPAILTSTYYGTKDFLPEIVWVAGAIIYLLYIPVLRRDRAHARKKWLKLRSR